MARTQATTFTSIWSDPEFVALTKDAQRLYWLLLSQPKLTLCGSLDSHPARWARLSMDDSPAEVISALALLEVTRFVVVDDDELVLRTFVANDLGRGTVNKNLVKGMWSAWGALSSPRLRKVVVDAMPSTVWNRESVDRPNEAEKLRSEPRLELPLEPWSEPSVDLSLLSDPCSLLTAPSTSPQTTYTGGSDGDPEGGGEDREQEVRRAAALIGRAEAAVRGQTDAYAAGIRRRILTDADRTDRDRIRAWLDDGETPEQIADLWVARTPTAPAPAAPARPTLVRPICDVCAGSGWTIPLDATEATRCECNPHPADREASA